MYKNTTIERTCNYNITSKHATSESPLSFTECEKIKDIREYRSLSCRFAEQCYNIKYLAGLCIEDYLFLDKDKCNKVFKAFPLDPKPPLLPSSGFLRSLPPQIPISITYTKVIRNIFHHIPQIRYPPGIRFKLFLGQTSWPWGY